MHIDGIADQMLAQIFMWAVTGVLGAFCGFLASRVKKEASENRAMEAGIKALLWAKLDEMHLRYVVNEESCDTNQKQTAQGVYDAYHALGGNGIGTQYMQEILQAHRRGKETG